MITSGQKEAGVNVIVAAARKAGIEAIEELSTNGMLNAGNFQRGILAQGDKIAVAVKATVKATLAELAENVVGRLKRLFSDRIIELAATDGRETLAEASDVFMIGIYKATKRGVCKTTPKTVLVVYEIVKSGTFRQIFGGFGENLKRLCWTENQIVTFCRDHYGLLRKDGRGTFFLFEEENGGFFVAIVRMDDDGTLDVFVRSLEIVDVWRAEFQHRVIAPQL